MTKRNKSSDYEICNCDCHEYGHLRHCHCCLTCPDCDKKIKYYYYRAHITKPCPAKIPMRRLAT